MPESKKSSPINVPGYKLGGKSILEIWMRAMMLQSIPLTE
jgi:hypothetical protein